MNQDYDSLLELAAGMGFRLLQSGAEIFRAEESVSRILQAYGVMTGEVFAIPNCIIVSLTTPDGHPMTRIRRIPAHGTDIDQLERYNSLCRTLCAQVFPYPEALAQLEALHTTRRSYPRWMLLCAHFLGGSMFSLFFGGTWRDGLCAGLCGLLIGLCLLFMSRLGTNSFFKTLAGAAVSALLAIGLVAVGLGENRNFIIIGALMSLVPGMAITYAMRDIIAGDMLAGISKAAEALLIGAAIALGTAFSIGLAGLFWGGLGL